MDPIFSIMLDVAGLISRCSDATTVEARRIAGERGSGAATNSMTPADQAVAAPVPAPIGIRCVHVGGYSYIRSSLTEFARRTRT